MRTLTERDHIRIRAQTKQAQLKAEAIDILIDAIHRQTRDGATVSFTNSNNTYIFRRNGRLRRKQLWS
jgi:hypothetical protein